MKTTSYPYIHECWSPKKECKTIWRGPGASGLGLSPGTASSWDTLTWVTLISALSFSTCKVVMRKVPTPGGGDEDVNRGTSGAKLRVEQIQKGTWHHCCVLGLSSPLVGGGHSKG
jgi:hypothetical protein